ncbi:MAG: hypothetical protein HOE90_25035 [Bacteriovoracaceae bacterium]|nr:hypothetical protein [Bacteriovoracaceae bacterium]
MEIITNLVITALLVSIWCGSGIYFQKAQCNQKTNSKLVEMRMDDIWKNPKSVLQKKRFICKSFYNFKLSEFDSSFSSFTKKGSLSLTRAYRQ